MDTTPTDKGYTYAAAGRRDPFVIPLQPAVSADQARCRCAGPAGLLVQEIALRGVVRTPKGYRAVVEAPDRKLYFIAAGTRFYDGFVVAVDDDGLTVRQDVTDPLSKLRTREIRVLMPTGSSTKAPE